MDKNTNENINNDINDNMDDIYYDPNNIIELEDEIKKKNKKIRILIIVNIILIILLLLMYLLGYRLGKIGYVETVGPGGMGYGNTDNENEGGTGKTNTGKIDVIEVNDDNLQWGYLEKDLNIFSNSKFEYNNIIAPNSSEIYEFQVKNITDENIEYMINFEDESNYNINMKYKLKIDNIYIAGNENTWVDIEELKQQAVRVTKNSNNVFTLEWKWLDNDKEDTYAGMQGDGRYTLRISINAKILENTKEN